MPDKPLFRPIPYGIGDFGLVRKEGYFYLDKTRFIAEFERSARFNFLVRPRRFGKSLLCGMLHSYYDIARRDRFDRLFAGTYIHSHPTPERNRYLVLSLNFSAVNPDLRQVEPSFNSYCGIQFRRFAEDYAALLPEGLAERIEKCANATDGMNILAAACAQSDLPIYLIIDEYDNFANTILATNGEAAYRDLTHGGGFFKHFFALFKAGTTGPDSAVRRMFVTGVSPVTMDDVTSGCNIGNGLSLRLAFNEVMGFTQDELAATLDEYWPHLQLAMTRPELDALLAEWYDGYRFHPDAAASLYNTDMVLYFLNFALQEKTPPDQMIDRNVRVDYAKLRHLMLIGRRLNGNFAIVNQLAESGGIASPVLDNFPVEDMRKPESFVSLLHYFGLLSFTGGVDRGAPLLRVPNETIRLLIYGYIRGGYEDAADFSPNAYLFSALLRALAYDGEWQPVFDFLGAELARQSSIRDYIQGELFVKAFLLAYLNIHDLFLTRSEPELNKGFADIVLEPFQVKYPGARYGCVVEVKYLKRGAGAETAVAAALDAAAGQLRRYRADPRLKQCFAKSTPLLVAVVFHGWEIAATRRVETAAD